MIDIIRVPTQNILPKKSRLIKGRKLALLLLLLAIIAAGVWFLIVFLSNSRTITLSEGSSYDFRGYSLTIDKVFMHTCPDVPNFNCTDWKNEPAVQIKYRNEQTGAVTIGSLVMNSEPTLNEQQLRLELLSVDLEGKKAKIKIWAE